MKRLFKAILGISCLLGWLGSCGNSGSAVLDSDLALYYKFNETGKYAIDSTGKTKSAYIDYMYNNAVYKKSIDPLKKAGVNGTSLSFDGMSNIISVEDFEQPTDSVSISLWIAPRCWESKNYAFEALVNNYNPSDKSGFLLGIHSYGEIVFEIGLEKEGTKILYGADNLANLYEWTQIGATYSSSSGRMCLYKNGQLINSITVLNHRRIKASTEVLTIGKNLFSTSINSLYENGYYAGLMDELKIYSRAISASRMKENYTSCLQNGEVPSCTYEDVYFSPDVLADDVFKPQYHTGADQMWMNEPYGLFYFKGKYHMFYQSQPHGTYLTYNSWGHVVSDDMVHWKNVFPAIVPEPNGIDNDACFSGNAIVDGNGVPYIIYTGVDNSRRALNVIAYATPEDLNDPDLIKWKKGHILFEQPEDCSYIDFRDPFLYREGDYTYMLVGTSTVKADYQSANPRCVCYKANNKDLTSWQYLGVTFEKDFATFSKTGYMWELPALYKLTSDDGKITKYLLGVCAKADSALSGVFTTDPYYWFGDFNTETGVFTPEGEEHRLDRGDDVLTAFNGFVDPVSGKTLMVNTVVEQNSGQAQKQEGWVICASLPRSLSLTDSGTLKYGFYSGLEVLHDKKIVDINDLTIAEANSKIGNAGGDMLHIQMTMEPNGEIQSGIKVRKSTEPKDGLTEETDIYYSGLDESIYLNTFKSGIGQNVLSEAGDEITLVDGKFTIDLYLDRSVLEMICNDTVSITGRIYPTFENSTGLEVYSSDNNARVSSLKIWTMNSIHGKNVPAYYGNMH